MSTCGICTLLDTASSTQYRKKREKKIIDIGELFEKMNLSHSKTGLKSLQSIQDSN